jgi:hypothetical protein
MGHKLTTWRAGGCLARRRGRLRAAAQRVAYARGHVLRAENRRFRSCGRDYAPLGQGRANSGADSGMKPASAKRIDQVYAPLQHLHCLW